MKKMILSFLALGFIYSANAWTKKGVNMRTGKNQVTCYEASTWCMRSVDPSNESPSVGDEVLINIYDEGVKQGEIIEINSDEIVIQTNEVDDVGNPIEIIMN